MKKLCVLSVVTAACWAAAFQVSAQPAPITSPNPDFQDTATSSTRLNVGSSTPITGSFNIESDTGSVTIGPNFSDAGAVYNDETGFNPALETVVSGTMNLWVKTTDGTTIEYTVNIDSPATGSIPGDGHVQYAFGSGDLSGSAIASLNADGELSYAISNGGHGDGYTDFTVEDIVLQVVTTDPPVPDSSSTAFLLAGAVAAIGFVRRKLA